MSQQCHRECESENVDVLVGECDRGGSSCVYLSGVLEPITVPT